MWRGHQEHGWVGHVLKAARKKADLTQAGLAKKLRKPQSFVSHYERGQRLDLPEFIEIVTAIGADPVAIFKIVVKGQSGAPKGKKQT